MENKFLIISKTLLVIATFCSAQEWSEPVMLAELGTVAWGLDLFIDKDDGFHLVWAIETDDDDNPDEICYSLRVGEQWSLPVNVSNTETPSAFPEVAVDDSGVVHFLWGENIEGESPRPGFATDVYYRRKIGEEWSDPISLYRAPDLLRGVSPYHIETDLENTVHVMWKYSIFVKYRYFRDAAWSDTLNVITRGSYPCMYVDSDNVLYVSFTSVLMDTSIGHSNNEVFYKFKKGEIWSDSVLVYLNPDQMSNYPKMVRTSDGKFHMIWLEDENKDLYFDEIYYSFSPQGLEWSEPAIIPTGNDTKLSFQLVVDSQDRIHMVWAEAESEHSLAWDKIYHTTFDGNSWSDPLLLVSEIGTNPSLGIDNNDYLHVFWTKNGYIYYSTTKPSMGIDQHGGELLPPDYALHPNYPNPFNPDTYIRFSLPRSSWTTLSIFDIKGQLVVTLLSDQLSAGTHTVQWAGKNRFGEKLGSGIYLYRLQAGDFLQTRKMVLIH